MDTKVIPPAQAMEKSGNHLNSTNTALYNGISYTVVREGLADILSLDEKKDTPVQDHEGPKPQAVFYNPIQQFNRDLSVLAIRVFGDNLAAVRKTKQERACVGQRGKKRKRGEENDDSTSKVGGVDGGVNETREPSSEKISGDSPAPRVAPFRILDALSATGLRAIRYAKEIPRATSIVANDLSPQATSSINLNVEYNKVSEKVRATSGDARTHMYDSAARNPSKPPPYEVIDLDPYGTASPFLDAAVKAVVDGGLLCVTCTDSSVFASLGYLEKTYSQYGGLPLKGPPAHEGGLRLILHAIAACAGRYGLSIEPLLSLSVDFYIRIFVRIRRSPIEVKFLASKTMVVYNCDEGCGAWSTQFLAQTKAKEAKNGDTIYKYSLAQGPSTSQYCPHCDMKSHLSGPMWGGPLHNPHFIQRILDILPSLDSETYGTIPRIEGMLSLALDETTIDNPQPLLDPAIQTSPESHKDTLRPFPSLDPSLRANHPFFIIPSVISKTLHCISPSDASFRSALAHLGYRIGRSHTKPGSISTDAPWSVIWEIMREWVRQKAPLKEDALRPGTAGWGIMRRDRSRVAVNEAKRLLKEKLEGCKDIKTLATELEAALWRAREVDGEKEEARNDVAETEEGDVAAGGTDQEIITSARDSAATTTPTHKLKIVFNEALGRETQGDKRLLRYQMNPRPDWGPMSRPKEG